MLWFNITQKERLQWTPQSDFRYGLGIFTLHGFLGHNGEIPGFQSWIGYCPQDGATMIVLVNVDQALDGSPSADTLAGVIYKILFA